MAEPVNANFDFLLRRLRMRHVELLTMLADVGSVHRAAEQLNLSQPAVSKMLREVEEVFDARLFDRGRRGVAPNALGRAAIHRARVALGELSRAVEEIQSMRGGAAAMLRIGTLSITTIVPAAIVGLQLRMPGASVQIREGRVRELLQRLLDGELDCVFGAVTPQVLENDPLESLHSEVIFEDRLCALVSDASPLLRKRRLLWRDLATQRWVAPPRDSLVRQVFMSAFVNEGVEPPLPSVETLSPVTIGALLRLDASYVGAVRHEQACDEVARGGVERLRVMPTAALPPLSLFTRRHSLAQPEVVLAFIEAMKDAARRPRREPARRRNG